MSNLFADEPPVSVEPPAVEVRPLVGVVIGEVVQCRLDVRVDGQQFLVGFRRARHTAAQFGRLGDAELRGERLRLQLEGVLEVLERLVVGSELDARDAGVDVRERPVGLQLLRSLEGKASRP